jgi:hypothetical protein
MIPRYVLARFLFQLKKHNLFCKRPMIGPKKWQGMSKMGQSM